MSSNPTRNFKFAGIQLAVTADKAQNLKNAQNKIAEAAQNGAQVIALPECFNCPYGNNYFPQYAEETPNGPTSKMLSEAAAQNKVYLIGGSFPEREGDKLFNTSLSFGPDGSLIGKFRKVHLFDIDIPGRIRFIESETLSPGEQLTILRTEFCDIGIGICYDIRFPEVAQIYQQQGCRMICYPGAFNMTTGPLHWELLQRGRAVDNQIYIAGVSPARDQSASYIAWGHSSIVNPLGEILAKADENEGIIYATIDFERQDEIRQQIPYLRQKRNDIYQSAKTL
jgi:omega-amidase